MNKIIAALLLIGGGIWLTRKKTPGTKPVADEKPLNPTDPLPPAGGSVKTSNVVISPQGPVVTTTQALPNVNTSPNADFTAQRKAAIIKTISTSLPQSATESIAKKIMAMSDSEVGTMENLLRAIATHQPLSVEGYAEVININTKYSLFPATMLAQLQPKPKAV